MNFALSALVFLNPSAVATDLASVHALVGDESLGVMLELVRLQFCQRWRQCGSSGGFVRCGRQPWREEHLFEFVSAHSVVPISGQVLTTARVVNNLLHDAPNVSIALSLC